MSVKAADTIDFSRLVAPARHGEVLVEPSPSVWPTAMENNRRALERAARPLLGASLRDRRRCFRESLGIEEHRPVIGLGHQPEWIHPGVWAKHVVADRAARAWGGVALNLLVDSDEVRHLDLPTPIRRGARVSAERLPICQRSHRHAYEQLPPFSRSEIEALREALSGLMGDAYAESLIPEFLEHLNQADGARDWVEQWSLARSATEGAWGIRLVDHRVSHTWYNPVVLDMVFNAGEFAASYNRALGEYRRAHRVRGRRRPMPDLEIADAHAEVPLWAYQDFGPRLRVLVARRGGRLVLHAGQTVVAEFDERFALEATESSWSALLGDWRIRPRALALTLWARLVACDFFVHGIGGAKYDRISDAIIADYYGIEPPRMACVSATLYPGGDAGVDLDDELRNLRRKLRDLEWNPQRNRHAAEPDWEGPARERERLSREAILLAERDRQNGAARRRVWTDIRKLNVRLSGCFGAERAVLSARVAELQSQVEAARAAPGREYFFALYARHDLDRLVATLPKAGDFAV